MPSLYNAFRPDKLPRRPESTLVSQLSTLKKGASLRYADAPLRAGLSAVPLSLHPSARKRAPGRSALLLSLAQAGLGPAPIPSPSVRRGRLRSRRSRQTAAFPAHNPRSWDLVPEAPPRLQRKPDAPALIKYIPKAWYSRHQGLGTVAPDS